ncbi:MAG TPA: glycoside hydrolase family 15 protein [Gammaproteobacteria bacterium]
MGLRIEDYGLIGDTHTAALVGCNGSIDWFCAPRFDSPACFAALLGDARHGRWLIAPAAEVVETSRRYLGDTLILQTEFATATGRVRLTDFMPVHNDDTDIVRVVEGLAGEVEMRMELVVRFDYGAVVPWVRRIDGTLLAIAGPDALALWSPVETHGAGLTTQARFTVRAGERLPFLLAWHPSHQTPRSGLDPLAALEATRRWWQKWVGDCSYQGPWRDAVVRSLITLKALTYAPTGGIVAAPTTSLPEQIGGVRNWDYRYCWLRDSTLTLYALLSSGYTAEAAAWRDWLLRAVAGDASQLQVMYGPAGERRLPEQELPWLPGYERSAPVRIGNAAVDQLQLDVFGEVFDTLHVARRAGVPPYAEAWSMQKAMLRHLERNWQQPDEGIWEVRGPRRHFTHSKVMCWVAFDRAIAAVECFGAPGPVEDWRHVRDAIHDEVCREGYDRERRTFTQFYGGTELDASLLLIPLVGFLPPHDKRVEGTVAAIERALLEDGFVHRYAMDSDSAEIDGLPPGEGAFLACTFWLADNYVLLGRRDDAAALFERLLSLRNDLGLLAEEYDPRAGRQLGNFPQAFSHVALVNTALNLARAHGPAEDRGRPTDPARAASP